VKPDVPAAAAADGDDDNAVDAVDRRKWRVSSASEDWTCC